MRAIGIAAVLGLLALGVAACGGGDSAKGPIPSRIGAVVPSSELPRVGCVWERPESPIEISLAADGTIALGGRELGLEELRAELRRETSEPGTRIVDGSSRREVVVRTAAALPWTVVSWVKYICADPNIEVRSLFLAVMPEAGGAEGVVPMFLPWSGSSFGRPEEVGPRARALLLVDGGSTDRTATYRALVAALAATPNKVVDLTTYPPRNPRADQMLSIADLAFRAGAERVDCADITRFPGTVDARRPAGSEPAGVPGSAPWLRAWVSMNPTNDALGVRVDVGSAVVDGASESNSLPAPPPRRPRYGRVDYVERLGSASDPNELHEWDLPLVGAVWDAPENPIEISLRRDGTILLAKHPLGLEELRQELRTLTRDPGSRSPSGESTRDVVLRVASDLPFALVQWVMAVCQDPHVRLRRLHFAVRSELGGVVGVVPTFLPYERLIRAPMLPVDPPVHAVRFVSESWPNRRAVYSAFVAALAATSNKQVNMRSIPLLVSKSGSVLSIVDLAVRAGAERILFEGARWPREKEPVGEVVVDSAAEPGSVEWLRSWVAAIRERGRPESEVKMGGTAESVADPLPRPPPRHARSVNGGYEESATDPWLAGGGRVIRK